MLRVVRRHHGQVCNPLSDGAHGGVVLARAVRAPRGRRGAHRLHPVSRHRAREAALAAHRDDPIALLVAEEGVEGDHPRLAAEHAWAEARVLVTHRAREHALESAGHHRWPLLLVAHAQRVGAHRAPATRPTALAVHPLGLGVAHAGLRLGLAPRRVRVVACATLAEVARHAAHVPHVVWVRVALTDGGPLATVGRLILTRVPVCMLCGGAPPTAMARELAAMQHEVGVRLTLSGRGPGLAGLVPVDQLES